MQWNVAPMRAPGRTPAVLLSLALMGGGTGCANYAAPLHTAPPTPLSPTRVARELKSLPRPKEQVVAAVYRFRDQTGQYKPSEVVASWSTAVTQGATSILMKALQESGWFVPIEREGLSNLLNERQIIQSIRAEYKGPKGEQLGPLPPLLYAGIILEGGVIGYDTNLLTSAIGARYFGTGGSGQYREDQVTIYLRAVSTQTGRVLKTVSTSKTIVSQQLDAGIFRFVTPDRLVEGEIGYSQNEPTVVAVTEAIEEAVKGLVLEGVQDGLWALADTADLHSPAFAAYAQEKAEAAARGPFGLIQTPGREGLTFAAAAGVRQYQGNYRGALARPTAELGVGWMTSPSFAVRLTGTVGNIGAEKAFESTAAALALRGTYYMLPRALTTPFLALGAGVMAPDFSALGERRYPFVSVGGGVEHKVTRTMGLNFSLMNQYSLSDELDRVAGGRGNDSVWNLTVGVTLY